MGKLNRLYEKQIISQQEYEKLLLRDDVHIVAPCLKPTPAYKNFWEAYVTCWKKYFFFSGRAGRYEFNSFMLINFLITSVLQIGEGIIISLLSLSSCIYLDSLFFVVIFIPGLALLSRRLHDIGKSFLYFIWWFVLPPTVVAVLGLIIVSRLYLEDFEALIYALFVLMIAVLIVSIPFLYLSFKKGGTSFNAYDSISTKDKKFC